MSIILPRSVCFSYAPLALFIATFVFQADNPGFLYFGNAQAINVRPGDNLIEPLTSCVPRQQPA
jgi:hypothetical protein